MKFIICVLKCIELKYVSCHWRDCKLLPVLSLTLPVHVSSTVACVRTFSVYNFIFSLQNVELRLNILMK